MKLGIIGGSGLYDMPELEHVERHHITTPFGEPSDDFVAGSIDGREVLFLPRHGAGHRLLPAEINHKANICAMKMLGATHVLSLSAVGSLRLEMKPRDVVIPDQYFDRSKRDGAAQTFFGEGVGAHIAFGEPVCPELAKLAAEAAREVIAESDQPNRQVHARGTYVNMEGPAFSTRAESEFYRAMNFDVIGMTNLFEAKLAREAELCYATVAMVTDYDCWHTDEQVSVETVVGHLRANVALERGIVRCAARHFAELPRDCACKDALAGAIITARDAMPRATVEKLRPIIGRYL